jgi:small subunit ribosomal protein S3Ae
LAEKAKSKEWFTIIAPKIFNEVELGKTATSNPDALIGRRITLSAIELTDDMSKYYMKFMFKIKTIKGDKAFSEFDGSECMKDYISRMVLRRIKRIDTVQDLVTKDGVNLRVKGLAIISRKVKTSVKEVVRNNIRNTIKKYVEDSTIEEFVNSILSDDLKRKVLSEARKIYPVRNFELRRTEVI